MKFPGSIGSQIMVAQQQQRHQKKLEQINKKRGLLSPKTFNYDYFFKSATRGETRISKKAFNEQMNHHLTLKHLIERLNSPKSYNQRLKDQNDFIAYPALFFRTTQNKDNKDKKTRGKKVIKGKKPGQNIKNENTNDVYSQQIDQQKNKKANKNKNNRNKKMEQQKASQSNSVNSQLPHNGLTLQKVKKQLPVLKRFEQQDIQLFGDNLTQLIFKYNLNTMDDIQYLFKCVEEYIPQYYPQFFISTIQDMFKSIVTQLNIQ